MMSNDTDYGKARDEQGDAGIPPQGSSHLLAHDPQVLDRDLPTTSDEAKCCAAGRVSAQVESHPDGWRADGARILPESTALGGESSHRATSDPDGLNRLPRWTRYVIIDGLFFEVSMRPERRPVCSLCGTHYPVEDVEPMLGPDGLLDPVCKDCLLTVCEPPEEDWSGF